MLGIVVDIIDIGGSGGGGGRRGHGIDDGRGRGCMDGRRGAGFVMSLLLVVRLCDTQKKL